MTHEAPSLSLDVSLDSLYTCHSKNGLVALSVRLIMAIIRSLDITSLSIGTPPVHFSPLPWCSLPNDRPDINGLRREAFRIQIPHPDSLIPSIPGTVSAGTTVSITLRIETLANVQPSIRLFGRHRHLSAFTYRRSHDSILQETIRNTEKYQRRENRRTVSTFPVIVPMGNERMKRCSCF